MLPKKQGLYSPDFEHDNCGAGFICSLQGKKTNDIIGKALDILVKLEHRGAVSSDGKTGDGAGILIEIPHDFLVKNVDFDLPELQRTSRTSTRTTYRQSRSNKTRNRNSNERFST